MRIEIQPEKLSPSRKLEGQIFNAGGKRRKKSIFVIASRLEGHQPHPPHPSRRQFNQAGYRQSTTAVSGISKLPEQSLDGQERHIERAATMICCSLVARCWCAFRLQDQGGEGVLIIDDYAPPPYLLLCVQKKGSNLDIKGLQLNAQNSPKFLPEIIR